MNHDSRLLVGKNIPKDQQVPGKRLPFFYLWMKDHYLQTSSKNFKSTAWSFNDDPRIIRENTDAQDKFLKQVPDIIGLGLYSWNKDILLDNARWYREQNPDALIIAGGPVAEATKEFFQKNEMIDMVILGPGIEIFKNVMDCVVEGRSTEHLQGITYMKSGELIKNPSLPKKHQPLLINWAVNLREEAIQLINEYHRIYDRVIVSTYFLHGCPYSCSFCEQGLPEWTKLNQRPIENLYKEIDLLCELSDNDSQHQNIELEFIDANFGITKDYLDIMKYFLDKNMVIDNKLILGNQAFAKNNVDTVFEIHRMIRESKMPRHKLPWQGYIALQDTNPEVLKLNGRPPSKEWEKLTEFKKLTSNDKYKFNEVDLMLGLPGQSYESLSVTLYDVFEHHLFPAGAPHLYTVLPNTPLTLNGLPEDIVVTDVWERQYTDAGVTTIDFDEKDYTNELYSIPYLSKTGTLSTHELMTIFYLFMFLGHARSHTRWIDTPLAYMKNYHGKSNKDFIKMVVKHFHPMNQHRLPDSIREDIKYLTKWLSGEDKLFMRRDNDDQGFLLFETIGKYRFHHSYNDTSALFYRIFADTIGKETDMLKQIMDWQDFITWWPGKKDTTWITYNYDDVASKNSKKDSVFYLSKFTTRFKGTSKEEILQKYKDKRPTDVIPNLLFESIPDEEQKPLNIETAVKNIEVSNVSV